MRKYSFNYYIYKYKIFISYLFQTLIASTIQNTYFFFVKKNVEVKFFQHYAYFNVTLIKRQIILCVFEGHHKP